MLEIGKERSSFTQKQKYAIGGAVLIALGLVVAIGLELTKETPKHAPVAVVAEPTTFTYVAESGDIVDGIAKRFGVTRDELIALNEAGLKARAEERCKKPRARGYYCNSRLTLNGAAIVHANSVQPGDPFVVPLTPGNAALAKAYLGAHLVAAAP